MYLNAKRSEKDREQRDVILPLIETKPHFYSLMTAGAVNTWALFNAFYGLRRQGDA